MSGFRLSDERRQELLKKDKEALVDMLESNMGSSSSCIESLKELIESQKKVIDICNKKEALLEGQAQLLQETLEKWELLIWSSSSSSKH